MAEVFITKKASTLPIETSMAAGDYFLAVISSKLRRISLESMVSVFNSSAITAAEIVDKLESLEGTERLDSSAIKNLVGGSGGGFRLAFTNEVDEVYATLYGVGNEDGWTLEFDSGVATLTCPEASFPISFSFKGTSDFATYSAGSYVGAFKIRVVQSDGTPVHDNEYADLLVRTGFVLDASNSDSISSATPLRFDPGLSERSIDEVGSGVVGLVFDRVAENFSGGWTIGF